MVLGVVLDDFPGLGWFSFSKRANTNFSTIFARKGHFLFVYVFDKKKFTSFTCEKLRYPL